MSRLLRFRAPKAPARPRRPGRLAVLPLEDRLTPAIQLQLDPAIYPSEAIQELATAINQANVNQWQDDLVLFPGGVYTFTAPLDAANGLALPIVIPTATKADSVLRVRIDGNGATLRRSTANGTPSFGLLGVSGLVDNSTPPVLVNFARAEINNLTFENGVGAGFVAGGLTVVGGYVDMTNVQFVNNKSSGDGGAVAAYNPGVSFQSNPIGVGIYNSTFSGNTAGGSGGAVFLAQTVQIARVTGSQFTNNTAANDGGAISAPTGGVGNFPAEYKGLYIAESTFVGNTAGGFGGAVSQNSGSTTFVNAFGPSVTLDRVTLQGNTAKVGGGVYADGIRGPLLVTGSTITGNKATGNQVDPVHPAAGALPAAGGIHTPNYIRPNDITNEKVPAQMVILENSIVAGNATVGGTNALYADVRGSYVSNGKNLIGVLPITLPNQTDPAFAIARSDPDFIPGAGVIPELYGTVASPADPKLGPLQDNGGQVFTRAPLPGSPVIDYGGFPDGGPGSSTDARGLPRIARGGLDLGAYEVQADGTNTVAWRTIGGAANPGAGQAVSVRLPFGTPFQARVLDPFGNPVVGAAVTFDATAGGVALLKNGVAALDALGQPVPVTVTTNAAGVASVSGVAGNKSGRFDVRVTTPGQAIAATFPETVVTDAPLAVFRQNGPTDAQVFYATPTDSTQSGDKQSAGLLQPYTQQLRVQVRDFTGGPRAGSEVVFQVLSGEPGFILPDGTAAGAGGVTFNGTARQYIRVIADANGVATVTVTADTKLGPVKVLAGLLAYTNQSGFPPQLPGVGVTFKGPVLLNPIPFTLTNLVGPAAGVTVVSGGGQTTPALSPVGSPLTVVVRDVLGNPVAGVPVTFTAPVGGASVTFGSPPAAAATVTTGADGMAAVAATATGATGSYQVTATLPGVATPAVFNLTNASGLGAQIAVVSGDGQSAGVGQGFAAPLRVRVLDAAGNPAAGATVTFAAPVGGGSAATFPGGATALTDADGYAQVPAAANTRAGQYRVTATIPGGLQAVFTLTNLVAEPATLIVQSGGGQTATGGTAFASPIVFVVQDKFGNPFPGVTAGVTAPAAGASATFAVSPTDAAGVGRAVATANQTAGTYTVRVTVGGLSQNVTLTNTAAVTGPSTGTPQTGLPAQTAVGTGEGVAGVVSVYAANGNRQSRFSPYDPGFAGGVRPTVARTPDAVRVLVVPGPGRFPDARVFDTAGNLVSAFQPFETGFVGGLFAAAGDIDRDGFDDYAVSPDQGGGPRVQVRSGRTGQVFQDFFAIDDPAFRGGARVALGDVNGDKVPDLVVSAGFGGGPRVAVYDGTTLTAGKTPQKLVGDFFAFEQSLRNGAFVAAGDMNGDGLADVVLGAGPGGGPRVKVLDGRSLIGTQIDSQGLQVSLADFYDGDTASRGGVRVAARDLNGDGTADLVTGSGAGAGSKVTMYAGRDLRPGAQPSALRVIDDLSGFAGGVFVG
ncbi:MAG: Ig-like domain-containing protein [Gemmataceae bacterium]